MTCPFFDNFNSLPVFTLDMNYFNQLKTPRVTWDGVQGYPARDTKVKRTIQTILVNWNKEIASTYVLRYCNMNAQSIEPQPFHPSAPTELHKQHPNCIKWLGVTPTKIFQEISHHMILLALKLDQSYSSSATAIWISLIRTTPWAGPI